MSVQVHYIECSWVKSLFTVKAISEYNGLLDVYVELARSFYGLRLQLRNGCQKPLQFSQLQQNQQKVKPQLKVCF